jgi:protein TonB
MDMTDLSLTRPGLRAGYSARRHRSPGAMAAAVAINGGVFALLIALPATEYLTQKDPALPVHWVSITPDPEPVTADPVKREEPVPTRREQATTPDPEPYVPPVNTFGATSIISGTTEIRTDPLPRIEPQPVTPVHVPLFRAATQDPRYADAFRPAYPPALQRQGLEGSVTVRIGIDENGRVISVEMVQATNKVFFQETRTQALRHWRFRPATRDGIAVPSEQTLTVHFQLDA